MPLWYIYYRVIKEIHRRPRIGGVDRMSDVIFDLRNKAIEECTSRGIAALDFHEFIEKVRLDEIVYTQHGLETMLKQETWFNPVKRGDNATS